MKRSKLIWFEVTTPGGLILRLDLEHVPDCIYRAVKDDQPWEEIVAYFSRHTNCPCRIRTEITIACGPVERVYHAKPKPIPKP